MRENGSYMEVDGKEIKSSYLDVKKLYKSSIMKKQKMEGRNELKFVFNINKIYYFYSWMNNTSKLNKKFPDRVVNSLYLDNVNFESAKDNLIGISKRQKCRIRW